MNRSSAYKDAIHELSDRYVIDQDAAKEFLCRDVILDCVTDEGLDEFSGLNDLTDSDNKAIWTLLLNSYGSDMDDAATKAIGQIFQVALQRRVLSLLAYRAQEEQDVPDPWRLTDKEEEAHS